MSFVQLSGRSWDGTEVVERFIKIISNEIIMNEIVIKKVIKKLFISIDNGSRFLSCFVYRRNAYFTGFLSNQSFCLVS